MKRLIEFILTMIDTYKEVKKKRSEISDRELELDRRDKLRENRDDIIKLTCRCANVDYHDFMDNLKCRERKYAYPRFVAMAVMHHSLTFTQFYVEDYFLKGHPACIHATGKVAIFVEIDREFRDMYEPVFKESHRLNSKSLSSIGIKDYYPEIIEENEG